MASEEDNIDNEKVLVEWETVYGKDIPIDINHPVFYLWLNGEMYLAQTKIRVVGDEDGE